MIPSPAGSSYRGTNSTFSVNCRNSNGLLPRGRVVQRCLSSRGSAPTWFTPNFKLKWLKPNPNPSLFVGTWFKFQFLMLIFPRIGVGLGNTTGSRDAPGHGREGEVMLHHLFLTFWGNFSLVWSAPSLWMLGLGGDGKPPAENLQEKHQSWRENSRTGTKTAPKRDFPWGWGWGDRCDPKVKLSALTGVVGIQIAAIGYWWRKTLSFSVCKTH